MVSNPRSYRTKLFGLIIVAFLVLPTPMLFVEAKNAIHQTNVVIDPILTAKIQHAGYDERIPIVVYFPEGSRPEEMGMTIRSLGLIGMEIGHIFHLIPAVSLIATGTEILALSEVSAVQSITLDTKRSILSEKDSRFYATSSLNLDYEHFTSTVSAEDLWDQGYFGNGTTVAILDSGAQGSHPDLTGQLIGFRDFIGSGTDMNPSDGINAYDDNGHGTACAWNVAGTGVANGGNYTGAAPGAKLLVIKVLDEDGVGDDSKIAEGIEFAVDQGVDVISISLGGPYEESQFIVEPSLLACAAAVNNGVSVVVAAGNSGPAPFTINSPAVLEEVITVGASAGAAGVVAFSSRGPVERTIASPIGQYAKPDIVAPGSQVVSGRWVSSNTNEYPLYEQLLYGANYTQWSGTSASAPIVAGLVALLEQKHSGLTPLEAKIALMAGATDIGLDSMEQGWGVPNVTLSSDIIAAGSGSLAIMTPRSYPTLPDTSTVLVIGEDRVAQNMTVMSTVSRGTADILLTGNASQFIEVGQDTVNIRNGYSHFSMGLNIPVDLPLSGIGNYIGELVLAIGGENITSMEIEFTITTYGGRLLVDMIHHDPGDIDDPSAYRYFEGYLREQGVVLDQFANRASINLPDLSTAEAFMIMDTETSYSQNEIEALHTYVEEGGTLLVLSEYYNATTQQASFAIDSYNEILAPYGIECLRVGIGEGPTSLTGEFYGEDYLGAVESDPLMDGVSNLYILWGSTLSIDPSVAGARGLFWIDQAKTEAIVAAADVGNGHVIVISDGSTLYDDILYDAIRGGADNLRLLRNLARMILPASPRIYDVVLNGGRIGEEANLTAYVFDDNLDDVTITIVGPDGVDIPGTVEESLGYKFSMEFMLESGGFFDVTIIASDSSGNTKEFHKLFLVQLDPADDLFITTVTFGLLGIVGVSLLYVVIIRRSSRTRRRPDAFLPRDEPDEYTPPPSIS